MKREPGNLLEAAKSAVTASRKWGPTDDGTEEGRRFEDEMVTLAAFVKLTDVVTIRFRFVSTPGGRGRNSGKWEATRDEPPFPTVGGKAFWVNVRTGRSQDEAVGKCLGSYLAVDAGKGPPLVIVEHDKS
jgi:hypothetical protein